MSVAQKRSERGEKGLEYFWFTGALTREGLEVKKQDEMMILEL